MNYELAENLKKAGFPQETELHKSELHKSELHKLKLHELIASLGNCQFSLYRRVTHMNEGLVYGNWEARILFVTGAFGEGNTPEEAVVNLYLCLHTKV